MFAVSCIEGLLKFLVMVDILQMIGNEVVRSVCHQDCTLGKDGDGASFRPEDVSIIYLMSDPMFSDG